MKLGTQDSPEIRCVHLLWVSKGTVQHPYWMSAADAVVQCPDSSPRPRHSLASCQGCACPENLLISTGLNSIQKVTPIPEQLIGTAEAFAAITIQLLPVFSQASLPESTPNQPCAY